MLPMSRINHYETKQEKTKNVTETSRAISFRVYVCVFVVLLCFDCFYQFFFYFCWGGGGGGGGTFVFFLENKTFF